MKNRRGWTFIGFLIVLGVLVMLGGVITFVISRQAQKARSMEALSTLQSTRESMLRYFAENGTYVGATIPTTGAHFSYTLEPAPTETTFRVVATRIDAKGKPVSSGAADTFSINEAGEVRKNGIS